MTKVKICGITNAEDARASIEAGADALGFNFSEQARAKNRYIDPVAAAKIVLSLPPFVTSVGVCVNPRPEEVAQYLQFCDIVQLHGDESADMVRPLAERVLKAFRLAANADVDAIAAFPCRAHLVDASVAGEYGGTGETCDWDTAAKLRERVPNLILAGGLTPDNVAEAIARVRPYAVDVAGGVESEPGKKDHERIRAFINAAKAPASR